jgi:hypothetical protein
MWKATAIKHLPVSDHSEQQKYQTNVFLNSKRFWRCCIVLCDDGLMDFVHQTIRTRMSSCLQLIQVLFRHVLIGTLINELHGQNKLSEESTDGLPLAETSVQTGALQRHSVLTVIRQLQKAERCTRSVLHRSTTPQSHLVGNRFVAQTATQNSSLRGSIFEHKTEDRIAFHEYDRNCHGLNHAYWWHTNLKLLN